MPKGLHRSFADICSAMLTATLPTKLENVTLDVLQLTKG